jgi:hypothetical protein
MLLGFAELPVVEFTFGLQPPLGFQGGEGGGRGLLVHGRALSRKTKSPL